jgi:hypothetical protein
LLYIFFFLFRAPGTQFAYREFAYREAPKICKKDEESDIHFYSAAIPIIPIQLYLSKFHTTHYIVYLYSVSNFILIVFLPLKAKARTKLEPLASIS